MANCKTCGNAIFNPWWGEYKCSLYEQIMYDISDITDCPEYKEGEPKDTLNNPEDDAK